MTSGGPGEPGLRDAGTMPRPMRRDGAFPGTALAASPDSHVSRAIVQVTVEREPGIHVSEIAERTGLSWHTVDYHLGVLRRSGRVVLQRKGRNRCVFPTSIPRRQRRWLASLRADPARAILLALLEDPGQGIPALARRTGLSMKVVRRRVADLVRAGILTRAGTWRPVYAVRRSDVYEVRCLLAWPPAAAAGGGAVDWEARGGRAAASAEGWHVLGSWPQGPQPDRMAEGPIGAFARPASLGGLGLLRTFLHGAPRLRSRLGARQA